MKRKETVMDAKKLIELRKEAEKVVEGMPDGEIKIKAFEVVLNHLISGGVGPASSRAISSVSNESEKETDDFPAASVSGRLLVLREEGFFKNPKSLAEIREELKAHGWHYQNATIATRLIKLVQKQRLRRQKIKEGNKSQWKYTNP